MKFKFCSEGDCPLWALAALHALGSIPVQLFRSLVECTLDDQPDDGIKDILQDTSLSSREECARAAAVIRWVLKQAWSCSCTGAQLTRDLLVVGVPRAHANTLADALDEHRGEYEAGVKLNGFMVNKVTDVSISSGPEGTFDAYLMTLHSDDTFTGEQHRHDLIIDKAQANALLDELKKVKAKMEELDTVSNQTD